MKCSWIFAILSAIAATLAAATPEPNLNQESSANLPVYTPDGNLKFPTQYREWTYVTSGVDMSYGASASMDHSMFDNVFVNPEAYKVFVQTGTWPDKTMLVLEVRTAEGKGSINKSGHFQTNEIVGREVHVKDAARFPGKWAFFTSEDGVTGKLLPKEMECYSCHEKHAAVDTTFVQFYPTLLDVAKKKKTLSASYLKEEAGR
jgi:hypothetical protein